MGSKSTSSTTTVKRLPAYAEPYCLDYIKRAEALSLDTTYLDYDGSTIAEQSQDEIDGVVAMASRGRDGDPVMNVAVIVMELILNGSFLLGTRQAFINMWSEVQSPLSSEMDTLKGLLGGTAYYVGPPIVEDRIDGELSSYATTILDRIERKLYRENYNIERELESVASGSANSIGGHSILDAELLRKAGLSQREYNSAILHDLYRIWLESQDSQIKKLDILGNGIRALVGTQSAITKPYYRPSKVASAIGGAAAGASVGSAISTGAAGGVYGAIIGGVIGLLTAE